MHFKWVKAIGAVIVILMVLFFFIGVFNYRGVSSFLDNSIVKYGYPAMVFSAFFLDLTPQPLSAHLILLDSFLVGMTLPVAVLMVAFGAFIASIAGFWLGRKYEVEFFKDLFHPKLIRQVNKMMKGKGKWYVLFSAVTPLPFIPILFGAFGMSWRDFIFWGIIPRVLGFVGSGIILWQIF